jgi:hypothetical protein
MKGGLASAYLEKEADANERQTMGTASRKVFLMGHGKVSLEG